MRKLTAKSEHGKGYSIAAADMPDAINKLGALEDQGMDLLNEVCGKICTAELFEEKCVGCPVSKLVDLLYSEEVKA